MRAAVACRSEMAVALRSACWLNQPLRRWGPYGSSLGDWGVESSNLDAPAVHSLKSLGFFKDPWDPLLARKRQRTGSAAWNASVLQVPRLTRARIFLLGNASLTLPPRWQAEGAFARDATLGHLPSAR